MSKPKLTPHQKWVLDYMTRLSGPSRKWVPESIGNHSGVWHLIRKGYVEHVVEYGPRGGAHYSYRPLA